jgi:mycofactocin system transcriptional regulator
VSERGGRPPVTSRADLEQVALALFAERGFAETTVDDIAAEAGISRRTFFRYFASKNDVVWGEFDALLRAMDEWLGAVGDDEPMLPALTDAVVRFNAVPPEAEASHRERMSLILRVPALQAHSTLRYAEWRRLVASFAARRLDEPVDAASPQLVGHLALGAAVAAYEAWLRDPDADLGALLRTSFAVLPDESALT